jgi:hypothetical protein
MPVPPPLPPIPPAGRLPEGLWRPGLEGDPGPEWGDRLLGLAMSIVHPPSAAGRDRREGNTAALATAVASIVAIAAQRAAAAGDLAQLRALVERALDAAEPVVTDAPDAGAGVCNADADPGEERRRLLQLASRQG